MFCDSRENEKERQLSENFSQLKLKIVEQKVEKYFILVRFSGSLIFFAWTCNFWFFFRIFNPVCNHIRQSIFYSEN